MQAEVLVQGIKWVLKMYLEGECSDYRFTYDAYGPSASQLLAALGAEGQSRSGAAAAAAASNDNEATATDPIPEESDVCHTATNHD